MIIIFKELKNKLKNLISKKLGLNQFKKKKLGIIKDKNSIKDICQKSFQKIKNLGTFKIVVLGTMAVSPMVTYILVANGASSGLLGSAKEGTKFIIKILLNKKIIATTNLLTGILILTGNTENFYAKKIMLANQVLTFIHPQYGLMQIAISRLNRNKPNLLMPMPRIFINYKGGENKVVSGAIDKKTVSTILGMHGLLNFAMKEENLKAAENILSETEIFDFLIYMSEMAMNKESNVTEIVKKLK